MFGTCRPPVTAALLGLSFSLCMAAQNRPAQAQDDADRAMELWKNIKVALTSSNGANYFEMQLASVLVPTLKGKLIKLDPEVNPKVLVLAIEDGTTPDATLMFDAPLPGKVAIGTELSFEGVAQSYTARPYMLVFEVERDRLHGWTGKKATPAHHLPVQKKAPASK